MLEFFSKKLDGFLGGEKDMFEGLTGEAKTLVEELRPIIDSLPETDYGKHTLERVIKYYHSNGTQKKNELSFLLNEKYAKEDKLSLEQVTDRVQEVIKKIEKLCLLVKGPRV